MEAVYINLSTTDHKADFKTELDGTANIVRALDDRKDMAIIKISGLGVRRTDGWWPDVDQKFEAENIIKESDHPYIIFRPTWFFESLPLFIRKKKLVLFGRLPHPLNWIAGDDLGRMVVEALRKNIVNRTFNVQGINALTLDEAAERFTKVYDPEIKVTHMPLTVLRLAGIFNPGAKELYRLFRYYSKNAEEVKSEETWTELYRPRMTVEEYVDYMRRTGDIPKK